MRRISFVSIVLLLTLILPAQAQSDSHYFAETGHTVKGRFLQYWDTHGGLQQQGYPISEELQEKSDLDGKSYTVQYFERAEFEYHPENQPPNDVLLAQLGTFRLKEKYAGKTLAAGKDGGNGQYFAPTGHSVDGRFLQYWQANGGLVQQGYPISERLRETSELDGKEYTVQYFERAVLELHSDNQPPNDVLLSQLGTFRYKEKYETPATATPAPTTISSPTLSATATPAAAPATPTIPSDPSLLPGVYIAQPQLKRGSYQTITITTKAGANVTVVCTYPSGDKTSNGCSKLFKDGPKVPDDKGHVLVRWRVGSTTHPGKVIVNVTVEMNGAQGTAQTSFEII
jgi:hypothetical protein